MGSDPLLLVFDTAAAHCAAAVVLGDTVLAQDFAAMSRGQGEALVPLLGSVMARAGRTLEQVTAVGVGIGPGNFTGTRISVATARGLSLALGCPALGVSTFDLMCDPASAEPGRAAIVSVPAPRDMAYVQHYLGSIPRCAPLLINPAQPPADLRLGPTIWVTGHRAMEIAGASGAEAQDAEIADIPRRLGEVTAWKWRNGLDLRIRPAPLYVRPPDAAPAADTPPKILP